MNTSIAKKIFSKDLGEKILREYKPELFGLKSKRCRKVKYLGDDLFSDICLLDITMIRAYTRKYSITEGKYSHIHNDLDYHRSLIIKTRVDKSDSPCHPEKFSESVVKPLMRQFISEKRNPDDDLDYYIEQLKDKLENHFKERINQQSKADYSEYLIMMNCPNIIPTLKHTGGTDMYLVRDDGSIEDLDIKTTRNIWGISDKKEAIKELYQKQGKDRFSSNPRLYIHLSDNELCDSENIIKQMDETYNIDFTYDNTIYNVSGCRLIII